MSAENLVLLVLFVSWINVTLGGSNFLPFQNFGRTDATTETLAQNESSFSGPKIDLPSPGLPYLRSGAMAMALAAYVTDNGMITLNGVYQNASQSPGIDFTELDGTEVLGIAPYWSDNDIRMEGEIRYEVLNDGFTNQVPVLAEISEYITNKTGTTFTGAWMLLAEWRECPPFPHGDPSLYSTAPDGYIDLRNSYQAIVITDRVQRSYAVFIYQCNTIRWSGRDEVYAKIGLTDGFGNSWVHNISGVNESANIDCFDGQVGSFYNILLDLNTFLPVVRVDLDPSSVIMTESMSMTTSIFMTTTQNISMTSIEQPSTTPMPTMLPTSGSTEVTGTPIAAIVAPVVVACVIIFTVLTILLIVFVYCNNNCCCDQRSTSTVTPKPDAETVHTPSSI